MRKNIKNIKHIVISFAVLILVWQIAVSLGNINTSLFPTPVNVVEAFRELWTVGLNGGSSTVTLIVHIGISMARFLTGFIIAALAGIIAGLVLGYFPGLFAYVNPVIQLIRPIAPVAWMPFIVLWFGIGNIPAVVIIFIAGFFPVLLSTARAVNTLDPVYRKVAANFDMTGGQMVRKIILPAVFPQITSSLQLALGTSWIFLVSGEMIGAQTGLGFLIMDAKNCIRPDALMSVMITIGLIGLILNKLIALFEHKIKEKWGIGNQ